MEINHINNHLKFYIFLTELIFNINKNLKFLIKSDYLNKINFTCLVMFFYFTCLDMVFMVFYLKLRILSRIFLKFYKLFCMKYIS